MTKRFETPTRRGGHWPSVCENPLSTLYVEYTRAEGIESVLGLLKERGLKVSNLEISRTSGEGDEYHYCAIVSVQLEAGQSGPELANRITELKDVITVEEL